MIVLIRIIDQPFNCAPQSEPEQVNFVIFFYKIQFIATILQAQNKPHNLGPSIMLPLTRVSYPYTLPWRYELGLTVPIFAFSDSLAF